MALDPKIKFRKVTKDEVILEDITDYTKLPEGVFRSDTGIKLFIEDLGITGDQVVSLTQGKINREGDFVEETDPALIEAWKYSNPGGTMRIHYYLTKNWDTNAIYSKGDYVIDQAEIDDKFYISKTDSNKGNAPRNDNGTNWEEITTLPDFQSTDSDTVYGFSRVDVVGSDVITDPNGGSSGNGSGSGDSYNGTGDFASLQEVDDCISGKAVKLDCSCIDPCKHNDLFKAMMYRDSAIYLIKNNNTTKSQYHYNKALELCQQFKDCGC